VRTIAVTNQKGGSAKTTSAVNLAAALGEKGHRVLVIDLDPQASASAWLGVRDGGKGLLEVFTGEGRLEDIVVQTSAENVDLVPSSAWLANAEKALAGEPGAETVLRRAVARLEDRWDFCLIDCPPALGLLTIAALTAADEVIVPLEVSAMALAGLAGLTRTVELVADRLNPGLSIAAVLACRVDGRTNLSKDVVESLRASLGSKVMKTVVRENVRLREAWSFGQPITVYDPRSAGAEDYRAAAAELLRREPPTITTSRPKSGSKA
jgi:chromosome partitioning protein